MINSLTPIYSWDHVPGAIAYTMVVYDMATQGTVFSQMFMTAEICSATRCDAAPLLPTTPGSVLGINKTYAWYVAAGRVAGWGPWSNGKIFYGNPSVDALLAEYQVYFMGGGWSDSDKTEMLTGVINVDMALRLQYGGFPHDTFKRVMFFPGRTRIELKRVGTGGFCTTNNNVAAPLQAEISCGTANIFSQYTGVHEFGHVFVGRTGGTTLGSTFFGLMNNPPPNGFVQDFGNSPATPPGFLFGKRKDPVSQQDDWVRGGRGWGSAASTPPALPCNFQQNPYTVQHWTVTPPPSPAPNPLVVEVDEASADTFLNWVYFAVGVGGFQNVDWRASVQCSIGTPQPAERPGDARMNFMATNVMPVLAGNFPTVTPTLTPTP